MAVTFLSSNVNETRHGTDAWGAGGKLRYGEMSDGKGRWRVGDGHQQHCMKDARFNYRLYRCIVV